MTTETVSSVESKRFPKTDVRYWRDRLFKRCNDEWQVQIAYAGRQKRFPLKTANKDAGAAKARDIYLSLNAAGWDGTIAKFKPWTTEAQDDAKPVTVGQFIEAVRAVAPVRATTFTTYERKLRFLVAQVKAVESPKDRYDYVHSGFKRWREKVDAVPLTDITPELVLQWRVRYINEAGKDPLKQNGARQTAASILRNAKALFSPKLLRNLGLRLPSPLPFDGVDLGKRPRTRYKSKVNTPLLLKLAYEDLKEKQPELFKIFLLAIGAGLRRNEIDKLTWKQFDWKKGVISIEATEYGAVKTEASAEEIDIGADMVAYFKGCMAKSQCEFVVSSAVESSQPKHWNHYRCDRHFKDLIEWLRKKKVEARNPIHTLRKEFGSLINQQFGIFAASAALRHSSIGITREHYVDRKERIALNLGDLVKKADENDRPRHKVASAA
jgi:integrase